jgi:membrane fusion protein, multidrug efflux system
MTQAHNFSKQMKSETVNQPNPTGQSTGQEEITKAPPASSRTAGRRTWLLVAGTALFAVAFYFALDYVVKAFTHESTDDAFLESDVVAVAPRVAGQVRAVHVKDNQLVKRGEPLLDLDPQDYEVSLSQKQTGVASAEANLSSAKAGLELMKARLNTAEATQRQEQANAEASRATAERAQADLKRAESLHETGVMSPGEFDSVRADAKSAKANLVAAEQKAEAATSQVAEARAQVGLTETLVVSALARIQQSRVDQQAADLDLSYTKVVAPADGRVTRKAVESGNYVQVGQSLLALVSTNFWVVANFKETQLTDMRPGQPAVMHIDTYPDKTLRGHVDSIMAGSGGRFSLLPPENAVGNFVKVVQRVPVKILFDNPPPPAMSLGAGMSVMPDVRTSPFTVSPLGLWFGALVLGVLAALGLARVIDHLRD